MNESIQAGWSKSHALSFERCAMAMAHRACPPSVFYVRNGGVRTDQSNDDHAIALAASSFSCRSYEAEAVTHAFFKQIDKQQQQPGKFSCRTALISRRRASSIVTAAAGGANAATTAHGSAEQLPLFATIRRRAISCDAAAAFCCCPWDLHFNCANCRMDHYNHRSCIFL